uniref:ALIX V-shaped domain-containing protein n=1 Tax=Meloidogyne floridensis TaxID=298350 RepID=A0A915P0Y5_9BILA
LNELPGLYKRNEEILNECSRLLKDEKETDENLRKQFTTKWTRMPSENLTPPFLQELGKFRGILQTAANADVSVRSKFEQNKRGMELLSLTENDLKLSIPGIGTYQSGASNSETVPKLRNLMNQIRCDMSNDFSKSLSETGVVDEKLSSDKIANLFKPLRDKVESSIKRQDSVMEEVQLWHKKFHEERQTTGGAERENFLKGLATAYDAFFRLQGDLNEGTKFYNDLTPILVRLQQKISDFCFARQTEKEDLMKQVQQNIVSGNETAGKTPYPYGVQPQQQQAQMGGYNTPYPVQYPGTYPGAFPQQQFGAFPPPPAFNQQQQQPPNNPTNPFQ